MPVDEDLVVGVRVGLREAEFVRPIFWQTLFGCFYTVMLAFLFKLVRRGIYAIDRIVKRSS